MRHGEMAFTLAAVANAGNMASSNGSASVVPSPRNSVRLASCLPRNIASSIASPHLEGLAVYNLHRER